MTLEIFKGELEELVNLAEPLWNKVYKDKMRPDFFNLEFLHLVRNSCQEFYPLVERDNNGEIACLAFHMGFTGQILGKPVKFIYSSWLTALKATPRRYDTAAKYHKEFLSYFKDMGYDFAVALLDTGSHSEQFVKDTKELYFTHFLPITTPMVRVLGQDIVKDLLMTKQDALLLKVANRFTPPMHPKNLQVKEILPLEADACEKYLNLKQLDFTVTYTKDILTNALSSPNFQKTFKVLNNDEIVGVIHILDIDMFGKRRIGCIIIERFWIKKGFSNKVWKAFLHELNKQNKEIFLLPKTENLWESFTFLCKGFLPDFCRKQKMFITSLNPEHKEILKSIKTYHFPYR